MGGKRFADEPKDFGEEREINYKKVAIVILVVVLIAGCIAAAVYFIKFRKTEPEVVETVEEVEEGNLPKTYEGYDVLGEIVIEKVGIKNYILDSTETEAMDKAPVKLYGDTVNQEGNFCIAGHNYDEMFAKLIDLEVGDGFYIEDQEGTIQDYKITEILEVEPSDLNPLMPVTDKIQVTLITCEEEATQRLVIKAERVDIENEEEASEETTEENTDDATNTATNEV